MENLQNQTYSIFWSFLNCPQTYHRPNSHQHQSPTVILANIPCRHPLLVSLIPLPVSFASIPCLNACIPYLYPSPAFLACIPCLYPSPVFLACITSQYRSPVSHGSIPCQYPLPVFNKRVQIYRRYYHYQWYSIRYLFNFSIGHLRKHANRLQYFLTQPISHNYCHFLATETYGYS